MEYEKNYTPAPSQRNFVTPTNASQDSFTTHDKETEKLHSSEPEEEYDAAPAPFIARGPSETVNHREAAVNKYDELQRVVSQRSQQLDEEIEYPAAWKLIAITIALCLCVFCVALDNTIIATAIPRITDQFNALDDVGWYGSAYLLCTCAFQLFFGKLYNFFSVKWVYLIALLVFEVGSAICGAAPTSDALIVGRAVAGLGAAGLFSGSILIVSYTVPLAKRPIYVGFIGGMYGIASVAGPLLGGAFTDHLTWRWCFYINLPLGAIAFIFVLIFFKAPARAKAAKDLTWKEKAALMDLEGTAIFVPAIVCVLLALQWGGSKYAWSNAKIIALFVVFGVLIIAWIALQFYKGERATLPPRILMNRSVAGASAFSAFVGGSFFAIVYYVPIWFQAIQGATAVESGIRNLPLVLSVSVFSIVGGGIVTATGYYNPLLLLSTVLMSVGAGLISTFQVHTPHQKWISYQVLYGAGVGFGIQNGLIVVQNVLQPKDHPTGTAAIIFFQTFGGALLISVAQNVFQNQLIANLKSYVPDLNPYVVISTGATSIQTAISQEFLPRVLEAYNKALDQTFYVAIAMAVLSITGAAIIEWKSIKGKKIEMGGGA